MLMQLVTHPPVVAVDVSSQVNAAVDILTLAGPAPDFIGLVTDASLVLLLLETVIMELMLTRH